jgi:hypothetical protein
MLTPWTITTASGRKYVSSEVPANLVMSVGAILGSTRWADIDPLSSAEALTVWVAAIEHLEAGGNTQEEFIERMTEVLNRPMFELMTMIAQE